MESPILIRTARGWRTRLPKSLSSFDRISPAQREEGLEQPRTSDHESRDERNEEDDHELGVVQRDQEGEIGSRRRLASPGSGDTPSNERDHREDLEREDEPEESHLHPEEPVPEVEVGRLLESAENTHETGRHPEESRDAPDRVRLEESPQRDGIVGREAQIPQASASCENGSEAERKSKEMESREHRRGDHAGIIARR